MSAEMYVYRRETLPSPLVSEHSATSRKRQYMHRKLHPMKGNEKDVQQLRCCTVFVTLNPIKVVQLERIGKCGFTCRCSTFPEVSDIVSLLFFHQIHITNVWDQLLIFKVYALRLARLITLSFRLYMWGTWFFWNDSNLKLKYSFFKVIILLKWFQLKIKL